MPLTPYEVLGVALGALLVLRTNAGYERWWEASKLWGGIVNQCRNLAIMALAHGPGRSGMAESVRRLDRGLRPRRQPQPAPERTYPSWSP